MPHSDNRGGRVPPDNRPVQAKGVGENAKRHDLERRSVPFLHGSDLQQGDVEALRQGQRVAPKRTQQPATPRPTARGGGATGSGGPGAAGVPDPIQFIAERGGGSPLGPPLPQDRRAQAVNSSWLPFIQKLVTGPGSPGLLATAFIQQFRKAMNTPNVTHTVVVNLNDLDDALESALEV